MSETKTPTWDLGRSVHAISFTDRGLKRPTNQDASAIYPVESGGSNSDGLFLLADGVGGNLPYGENASRVAVAAFADHYFAQSSNVAMNTRVLMALQTANQAVKEEAQRLGAAVIGTTLSGLILTPEGQGLVFNIGDSRVYLLRQGSLSLLSSDQVITSVDEQRASTISQYVGQEEQLEPAFKRVSFQPGDLFFLCSDGVWAQVADHELEEILEQRPLEKITTRLMQLVISRGAPDNLTGVIIHLRTLRSGQAGRFILLSTGLLLTILAVGLAGLLSLSTPERENAIATLSLSISPEEHEATPVLISAPQETDHFSTVVALQPFKTETRSPTPARVPKTATQQPSPTQKPPLTERSSIGQLAVKIIVDEAVVWDAGKGLRLLSYSTMRKGERASLLRALETSYGTWFLIEQDNRRRGWVYETSVEVTAPLTPTRTPPADTGST